MNILKTIKIICPGIKYDINKPLLKTLNDSIRGDFIYLDYSFAYVQKEDDFNVEVAYDFALSKLKELDLNQYNEIIFIGKSIGTYIAGRLINELHLIRAKFICLTPLNITLKYLRQTDYIVYGTCDKYLDEEGRNFLKFKFVNLSIIDNANHRLEVNDNEKNIKILNQIKIEALTYLECSNYMD